jgi:hypothetical protein
MPGEDGSASLVGLALPDDTHPCSLEAKVESTDPCADRADTKHPPSPEFPWGARSLRPPPVVNLKGLDGLYVVLEEGRMLKKVRVVDAAAGLTGLRQQRLKLDSSALANGDDFAEFPLVTDDLL